MRELSETFAREEAFDIARLCRYFSELSPQPMLAVEGTTHIVRYANSAFLRLAGKSRTQLMGHDFAEAVPEGEENKCRALLDRVYHSGTPEILTEQQHTATLFEYWTYSVWPILGPDLAPVGVMIQVTDATEIAISRQQMVKANEQLLISGLHQHELTETAEKANRLKDDFLATLSHELRTPLTVIIGWSDMLTDPRLDDVHSRHAVEVIRRNARAQVQMIEDLLDVSRITSGKLHLEAQPVDLEIVASAIIDNLQLAADAKEIGLELQIASPLAQVSGDADRLQQVLWNLVSNAVKFTPKSGHVVLSLKSGESHLEIRVSDNGKGIAPGFLPHIFDRFRQADNSTTRKVGGLGLGLSIVRQLVELHGGTVGVESPGEDLGATFAVTLPLIKQPEEAAIEYSMPPVIAMTDTQCPPELRGLRILVVDDEADTREMLQFVLESCGVQVKNASSVREALEAVAENVFDVLISDIGMPEEDGYSLIAKVQALGERHGEKIPAAIALTAYASEEERARILDSGFQMHVPKPISPNELIAVVSNIAGRAN